MTVLINSVSGEHLLFLFISTALAVSLHGGRGKVVLRATFQKRANLIHEDSTLMDLPFPSPLMPSLWFRTANVNLKGEQRDHTLTR